MNEREREGTRETIYEREGMLHLPPSFAIGREHKVFRIIVATFLLIEIHDRYKI